MTRAEFYSNLMNYQKVQNDPDAETIKHYGIIGQKWGQRRWQNPDGTFGKTEKYNKLLNKFKPEDQELVADYVNKLNKNIEKNEDAYMYDFKNNRAKFDADSAKGVEQKVGGFGNIKNKAEADRAIELLENEYDKACSDIIHHMDEYDKYSSRAQSIMKQIEELDERFGSQPDGKKLNEKETINDTIKGIFSKKNKAEDTIKKLEEEGQEDIAKEYKKHAKDLEQYKKIGSQPGMSEEERKATKRACANCWKVAMRNKWPLFLLFGVLGGGVIGAIASNSKINKMIDQLGLDRQNKDKFTADDWDKITEAIKDSRRKKPKNAE